MLSLRKMKRVQKNERGPMKGAYKKTGMREEVL